MSNQESISKETKKKRTKKSKRTVQQIKLAVIMIMVSVLVLSASTFAWYRMSKTANVQSMEFTADTLGNLLISGSINGTYSNTLDLGLNNNSAVLLPATTEDGNTFYMPVYSTDGTTVESVTVLNDNVLTDNIINGGNENDNYVYVKEFYIKSGVNVDPTKAYKLKLADSDSSFVTGTYLKDKDNNVDVYDSVNAVRVSLVVGEVTAPDKVVIFEPYNTSNTADGTQATIAQSVTDQFMTNDELDYNTTLLISQNNQGILSDVSGGNNVLCEITEGTPVKITMFVWFEGMDDDCENEIALDTLTGQIQFEAEEKTTP